MVFRNILKSVHLVHWHQPASSEFSVKAHLGGLQRCWKFSLENLLERGDKYKTAAITRLYTHQESLSDVDVWDLQTMHNALVVERDALADYTQCPEKLSFEVVERAAQYKSRAKALHTAVRNAIQQTKTKDSSTIPTGVGGWVPARMVHSVHELMHHTGHDNAEQSQQDNTVHATGPELDGNVTESDSRAGDGKHDSIQCWAASVVVDPLQSPLESPWDSDILDNSADDIYSGKLPTVPRGRDSYLKQDLWNDVDYSTLSSRASSTSSAFPVDYRTAPPRPSHNFLLWLDGALSGLDTSISISETESMLLSLPLDPDASAVQVIEELIDVHNGGGALDGKRFSKEFVERRHEDAGVTDAEQHQYESSSQQDETSESKQVSDDPVELARRLLAQSVNLDSLVVSEHDGGRKHYSTGCIKGGRARPIHIPQGSFTMPFPVSAFHHPEARHHGETQRRVTRLRDSPIMVTKEALDQLGVGVDVAHEGSSKRDEDEHKSDDEDEGDDLRDATVELASVVAQPYGPSRSSTFDNVA
ncbi:hypothetical protein AcV5_006825 [Taiwanofungus camphoratus]|nr:hypothetical protein AcV5_006825 [Antrodia cinnamomea]